METEDCKVPGVVCGEIHNAVVAERDALKSAVSDLRESCIIALPWIAKIMLECDSDEPYIIDNVAHAHRTIQAAIDSTDNLL